MDQEVRAEVQEAVDFADASPLPGAEELYTHVYAQDQSTAGSSSTEEIDRWLRSPTGRP
jgi:TPP-dependent pyruvate/acetoin dehydrogenase alpha subunit